jgi:hypothetical protein
MTKPARNYVTLYWFFPVDWTANKVCRYLRDREQQLKKLKPEIYWSNEKLS